MSVNTQFDQFGRNLNSQEGLDKVSYHLMKVMFSHESSDLRASVRLSFLRGFISDFLKTKERDEVYDTIYNIVEGYNRDLISTCVEEGTSDLNYIIMDVPSFVDSLMPKKD